jgi:hypothetical protein
MAGRAGRARRRGGVTSLTCACGALLLAASCANPDGASRRPPPDRFPQAQSRCIPKRTISSWRSLDAYRIKVFADREYVVELLGRCSSLITSEDVVFDSRDSQICDYRNDEIRTDRESCVIGSIRTAEEAESDSQPDR